MSKKQDLSILRHSAAHLLAHAVFELYPDTLFTLGPATKDGFFYDMLPTTNFKESDLPRIEECMHEIAKRNLPITHDQMPKDEARKLFANNRFKLELIEGIPGDTVGIARQGDFIDLCRGGHVASTGDIKHFKLLGVSGSYWRADKTNQALQRISGTAFFTQDDMDEYEQRKEEAMMYDHRRLGKQLDLFSFHNEGVGFPFFHPKGKFVINKLIEHLRSILHQSGYVEISTPLMLSDELWKRSGHYDHYKENMYFTTVDDKSYAIRPMNCPGAFLVYNERPRSYRELPLRLSEFGLVHRHELSGVLHGLMRVRAFTIDDAHIFCTLDQLEQEIINEIELAYKLLRQFDFKHIKVGLSTKPDNAMGDDAVWQQATNALKKALEHSNIPYEIQEGEGAFYGPKLEFKIKDSMDREWQLSTVQVDFFQPINFDLNYVSSTGTKERCVVIHRAIYGSLERFFGIILEHFKGHLPFWLCPTQIKILTITDDQKAYAHTIAESLKAAGIRVEVDESSDQISGKIKTAQLDKIPLMLVVGNKEMENNTATLRYHTGKQEPNMSINDIISLAQKAAS